MFTATPSKAMSPWDSYCLLSSAGTFASSTFLHSRQLTGVSWSPRGNCSHSSQPGVLIPQPTDPQHSSASGIWDNSLPVCVRHPQHFGHHCTASYDKKTLDSITHRGADGKMHMCQWGTGSAAWAKEKVTEEFRELSEPSWTWATCKGITEFLHWAQLLLAQLGIHNFILILYIHTGEILLNYILFWRINVLCLPCIFFPTASFSLQRSK